MYFLFIYLYIDDRGSTFLKKNLHDLITASGSLPKNNRVYKADIEDLFVKLTTLLNSKVV